MHRKFDEMGANLSKNPIGTGPYELTSFAVGSQAVLTKRKDPYWGGAVFLDQIHYIDLGEDASAQIERLSENWALVSIRGVPDIRPALQAADQGGAESRPEARGTPVAGQGGRAPGGRAPH